MEILIAASIFAGVMIMTTGVLAQSSSFRGKIKATRETSEVTQKIADMVARDVRSASGVVKITPSSGGFSPVYTYDSGVALIMVRGISCTMMFNTPTSIVPGDAFDNTMADALVIATGDKYKVYLSAGSSIPGGVFYAEYPRLDANGGVITLTGANLRNVLLRDITDSSTIDESHRISSLNASTIMIMTGFAPNENAAAKVQPYVQFRIMSKTKDYDTLSPNARSKMEVLSTVTVRNFAN